MIKVSPELIEGMELLDDFRHLPPNFLAILLEFADDFPEIEAWRDSLEIRQAGIDSSTVVDSTCRDADQPQLPPGDDQ